MKNLFATTIVFLALFSQSSSLQLTSQIDFVDEDEQPHTPVSFVQ